MKRPGPELEYWVEVFDPDDREAEWEIHSIRETRAAAIADAEDGFKKWGGSWRVLDVAKWPVRVLGPAPRCGP